MAERAAIPADAHVFVPYSEYKELLAHKHKNTEKLSEPPKEDLEKSHNFPRRLQITEDMLHHSPSRENFRNEETGANDDDDMDGLGATSIKRGNLSRQERDVALQLSAPSNVQTALPKDDEGAALAYQDAGIERPADAADLRQVGSAILNEPMGASPKFPAAAPPGPSATRVFPPNNKVFPRSIPFWYIA